MQARELGVAMVGQPEVSSSPLKDKQQRDKRGAIRVVLNLPACPVGRAGLVLFPIKRKNDKQKL